MKKQKRTNERILLGTVSLIIGLMFFQFYSNIKNDLKDIEKSYKEKHCLQLETDFSETDLQKILHDGEYFMDSEYEQFFVEELATKMKKVGRISNLGVLNKSKFLVDATNMRDNGGEWGKTRYLSSATKLGLDSVLLSKMNTEYKKIPSTREVSHQKTGLEISGKVEIDSAKHSLTDKLLFRNTKKPVANVLVRLIEEERSSKKDTIKNEFIKNASQEELFKTNLDSIVRSPVFYVRTDANGKYVFKNLEKGKNYSVIPIAEGKEYGVLRGKASIEESVTINFIEKVHKLPLLGRYNYKRIKADKLLTVRTPQEFLQNLRSSLLLFLLGFWLLHLVLSIKGKAYDEYLLPLLMLLIGVGLVALYAIQSPLTDMDYVTKTVLGFFVILCFFALLVFFFNEKMVRYIADFRIGNLPLIRSVARKRGWLDKYPRGYEWLIFSIVLSLMLFLWGTGPEGSGVKVNLFGIQVSELSKFFILLFFAKYFTANVGYFRNIPNNVWLLRKNVFMFLGFLFLILIYAKLLGDLGPALVLCFTFLIIYSFAKGEFPQMIGTAILFVVSMYVLSFLIGGSTVILSVYSGIVFVGLLVYSFKMKKNESMFFIVSVISSFVAFEFLPFDFAKRLSDRNSMFRNPWDNSLHGGDQVVQGIWSIDSGGLFGQGLGNGFSNVMPAYHTDMIFASIGEELGVVTLLVLLIVFGLLFFRSMLIARRSGDTFLFFLINGIAIATLVQLAIIVGGSLGLMPLTGISVPFLSKGNVSLYLNVFAFLVILLCSQIKGKSKQMKKVKERFEDMNLYTLLIFMGVIILFGGALLRYWYFNERDMIRPVKVLSKQGEWMKFYNPRINIIKRELKAGSIYDRNGILLATSDRTEFLSWEDSIKNTTFHLERKVFNKQKASRLNRYYLYGEDLIYYLGDRNTGLVSDSNLGYVADYRLADRLLGFNDVTVQIDTITSKAFKEALYLPEEQKKTKLRTYDYSSYIPFLKAGKNSSLITDFNAKNKDVKLSLDVKMNQIINDIIRDKKLVKGKDLTRFKISVVALDAQTGEVLASAINPKPNKEDILKFNQIPPKYYSKLSRIYFGYENKVADRDLGMFSRSVPGSTIKVIDALAYLGRDGADSARVRYKVTTPEVILEKHEGDYDMTEALRRSSNVYFVRLVNEKELHPELFALHQSVGINLFDIGGYYLDKGKRYNEREITRQWTERVMEGKGLNYNNPRYFGIKKRFKQSHYSFMAWGQEPVKATPLQMARLYGAIAMDGSLSALNFVKEFGGKEQLKDEKKMLIKNNDIVNNIAVTNVLENAMELQSKTRTSNTGVVHYGKTGSPERASHYFDSKTEKIKDQILTDGWYVCYIKDTKIGHPLVFATRIEGLPQGGGASGNATALWEKIANGLKSRYFNEKKK